MPERPHLTTNAVLEKLIQVYRNTPVDWRVLAESFRRYAQKNGVNSTTEFNIAGKLAEYYIYRLLKAAQDANFGVKASPIPDGASRGGLRFKQGDCGSYEVFREGNTNRYLEIDNLCLAGGLPVVWEIKTGIGVGKDRGLLPRVSLPMRDDRIAKVGEIVTTYFGSRRFAYVVIFPDDVIRSTSSTQRDFRRKGGILLSLGARAIDHQERALGLKRAHGI